VPPAGTERHAVGELVRGIRRGLHAPLLAEHRQHRSRAARPLAWTGAEPLEASRRGANGCGAGAKLGALSDERERGAGEGEQAHLDEDERDEQLDQAESGAKPPSHAAR